MWSDKNQIYLKPYKRNKYGHLRVNLFFSKKYVHKSIHRLVLETFVGPCPPRMECRHLDGNASNNKLENLMWGTKKENNLDKAKHGSLKGERNGESKLTNKKVKTIRRKYKTELFTQYELALLYGVSQTAIWKVVARKTWKHL